MEGRRTSVPVKPGYFTVPDDPAEPPRLLGTRCAKCMSERTEDVLLGPRGTLFSYTFVHFPLFGSMRVEHIGYGVGQVDLPEGPRVQLPLAGKQEDYRVGQTLEAELEALREEGDHDVVIVRFRPMESGR